MRDYSGILTLPSLAAKTLMLRNTHEITSTTCSISVREKVDDMDSSLTLAQYKMHRQFLNGVMRPDYASRFKPLPAVKPGNAYFAATI